MSGFTSSEAVAIIPARGGSKGVPGKNLQRVGGVPLVARAVAAARAAGIETVVVSTDDDGIGAAARAAGGTVLDRPAAIAGDTATSESAVLHALDMLARSGVEPKAVAFLQATTPFIDAPALGRAVGRVLAGTEDSVFSAFETYAFLWRPTPDGADGVNHDRSFRPRRQDREPHYQETGAFYVFDRAGFQAAGFRFFGRVGFEEVPERSAIEIDAPEQLEIARALAPLLDRVTGGVDVDAIVTDFDGVHTDDTATLAQDGTESVRVSRSDGLGIGLLKQAGVRVLILSKERNPVVAARAVKLGVPVLQAVDDKRVALERWLADERLDPGRVAYLGNDVNDIPALSAVGWPVVVPDAHPDARAAARLVLTKQGGRGAVRELAELVLAGRNNGTA